MIKHKSFYENEIKLIGKISFISLLKNELFYRLDNIERCYSLCFTRRRYRQFLRVWNIKNRCSKRSAFL